MSNKKNLATDALSRALRLRKKLGINLEESVSPIEIAERLNIEVRLVDIPSMEGMYIASSNPKIILSSLRSLGRINFTCAHEIGHHIYGHGEQFDEITSSENIARKNDPREFSADCFAGYFLMPKATIDSGMQRRNYSYANLEPHELYGISSWLGVGYTTLINHMQFGLQMINQEKSRQLLHYEPQEIRQQIHPASSKSNLHIVDENWIGRAIDCVVGDYILVPPNSTLEGSHLELIQSTSGSFLKAKATGIAKISNQMNSWSAFIRISSPNYKGRSCYRFEEEVEE